MESRSVKSTSLMGLSLPLEFRVTNGLKFRDTTYHKAVDVRGRFANMMAFLNSKPRAQGNGGNSEQFNEVVYRDDEDFTGGTHQELLAPHEDFKPYQEAMKTLSQQKVWKQAVESFAEISVRKRKRCAYDGEFDYDKRWDAEPFQRRTTAPRAQRIVKMVIQCGVSAGVSAEAISRFAGFAAAIANLLERNGVMVEIETNYTGVNFIQQMVVGEKIDTIFTASVEVKRADEYLPPGQILKAMSPNFFRRAVFGTIIACAEAMGKTASGWLGMPFQFDKVFGIDGNTLVLYAAPKPEDQERIIAELIKMVGTGKIEEPKEEPKEKKPIEQEIPF